MSTTTTEAAQVPPSITVISRVASIPLVSLSLETIDQRLSSNVFSRSLYPAAKGLSSTAYKYTEPIQTRLAPLIIRADGFANKAVDVVEARYPYPFTVKPEEVTEYVRERRQSATDLIHHSIDDVAKLFRGWWRDGILARWALACCLGRFGLRLKKACYHHNTRIEFGDQDGGIDGYAIDKV